MKFVSIRRKLLTKDRFLLPNVGIKGFSGKCRSFALERRVRPRPVPRPPETKGCTAPRQPAGGLHVTVVKGLALDAERPCGPRAQTDRVASLSCSFPSSSRATEWSAAVEPWATTPQAGPRRSGFSPTRAAWQRSRAVREAPVGVASPTPSLLAERRTCGSKYLSDT